MSDKSFHLKIGLSAIAGFLFAALLVVVPGTMFMRPSRREGPQHEIWRIERDMIFSGRATDKRIQDQLDALSNKTFQLCILQNEISCWPFLLTASSVGPLLLLVRRKEGSTKFRQENMRETLLTLWWGDGPQRRDSWF